VSYTGIAKSSACLIRVGSLGTIERSDDNGATWTPQTSGTSADIVGVVFNGMSFCCATRSGDVIVSDSDGQIWSLKHLTSEAFNAIDCYIGAAGTVTAVVGNNGAAYVNNLALLPDNNWNQFGSFTADLLGVVASVVLTVFGANGFVASTLVPNGQSLGSMSWLGGTYAHGNILVLVGTGGAIARTDDGGTSWHLVQSGTAKNLNAVAFSPSAAAFYAVGDDDTKLSSITDGQTWVLQ